MYLFARCFMAYSTIFPLYYGGQHEGGNRAEPKGNRAEPEGNHRISTTRPIREHPIYPLISQTL